MRIGILGSGLMGGKLGTIFARAGHEVVFSYARSEKKLEKLAREARGKARGGTPREAAQNADAVLLAVHWLRFDDVLKQAGDLSGKVVLTCSLPMNEDNTETHRGPYLVGRGGAGEKDSRSSRRGGIRNRPERSVLRRLRSETQREAAEPGVLRRPPARQGSGRRPDPRRRLRSGGRRTFADLPLYR